MSLREQRLKKPRTHWRDCASERRHRMKGHLCEAWTTPWSSGSYWAASEPCTALSQLVVNGTRFCVKHARIEVLALVVRNVKVELQIVSRGRDLSRGAQRAPE